MYRTIITAALALVSLLALTASPALAQRRSDNSASIRNPNDRKGRGQADLVVRRIRFNGDDIRVEVANVGDGFAGPSRLAIVVVTREGRRTFTAEVPNLRPEQNRTVRIDTNIRLARASEIIAIVDFGNDIRERNERNNTLRRFVD